MWPETIKLLEKDTGTAQQSVQEAITLTDIHAPSAQAPKCVKQILPGIEGKAGSNTVIARLQHHTYIKGERSSRQKAGRKTVILSDTVDQWDLIDITNQQNTNSFQVHMDEFSRVDHTLVHKAYLNRFKRNMLYFSTNVRNYNKQRISGWSI